MLLNSLATDLVAPRAALDRRLLPPPLLLPSHAPLPADPAALQPRASNAAPLAQSAGCVEACAAAALLAGSGAQRDDRRCKPPAAPAAPMLCTSWRPALLLAGMGPSCWGRGHSMCCRRCDDAASQLSASRGLAWAPMRFEPPACLHALGSRLAASPQNVVAPGTLLLAPLLQLKKLSLSELLHSPAGAAAAAAGPASRSSCWGPQLA